MEGIVHYQYGGQFYPFLVSVQSGHLDCRFIGLGTGVAKEDLVHPRGGTELFSQVDLVGNGEKI